MKPVLSLIAILFLSSVSLAQSTANTSNLIKEKELTISQQGDVIVFPLDIAFMLQDNRIVKQRLISVKTFKALR
ncbi:MAG: hypothetical protein EOO20_02550 [Chryseobacterium sp.]|nr:MAG: hypothetical protein EOO20_02550 [Chryseobacterium sp.]